MIKQKYSNAFERLWGTFDSRYGNKGSKKCAWTAFKLLKCDNDDIELLESHIKRQILERQLATHWIANFQTVDRWFKNARWEDEPHETHQANTTRGQSTPVDRVRAAAQRRRESGGDYSIDGQLVGEDG